MICHLHFVCDSVKPRLHQIHVAGYKYPERATRSGTCIGIKWIHVAMTTIFRRRYRIHVDGDKGYKWIQLVSGRHVSGVNAALQLVFDCTLNIYILILILMIVSSCRVYGTHLWNKAEEIVIFFVGFHHVYSSRRRLLRIFLTSFPQQR